MNTVKILHTADLHLGAENSYLGTAAESRRFEVLTVFKNITETCREQGVAVCLIAGDLFDSNRAGASLIAPVLESISAVPDTRFFYVAGNHDPLDAASPFLGRALPENLTVFGTEFELVECEELGVRVIGKSFGHASMPCEPFGRVLPDDDLINIMLLHADLGADENSPYNPIDREFISGCGVDYLALGHIHKRSKVAKVENTYLAYPGCPEGQGFDEEGVKGVLCGQIGKGICELSFLRLCKRIHCVEDVDVGSATSSLNAAELVLKQMEQAYGSTYRDNLYKITLTGRNENTALLKTAEIASYLQDRLYFVKVKNEVKNAYDLDALKKDISLKGLFVKNMCKRLESAADEEKNAIETALYLGLEAFDAEVGYHED